MKFRLNFCNEIIKNIYPEDLYLFMQKLHKYICAKILLAVIIFVKIMTKLNFKIVLF